MNGVNTPVIGKQTYTFRNNSFRKYVGDEPRRGTVELTLDWDKIVATLGTKAAWNKSHKSGLQLGIRARFFPEIP